MNCVTGERWGGTIMLKGQDSWVKHECVQVKNFQKLWRVWCIKLEVWIFENLTVLSDIDCGGHRLWLSLIYASLLAARGTFTISYASGLHHWEHLYLCWSWAKARRTVKRKSSSWVERWSGELEPEWKRRDAEISTDQMRVDQEERREEREHSTDVPFWATPRQVDDVPS